MGKIRIPITLSQSIQYALIPIIVTENGGATTRDYEVSHDSAYFRNRGNAAVTVYAEDDTVVDGNGEGITPKLRVATRWRHRWHSRNNNDHDSRQRQLKRKATQQSPLTQAG